jgi:hypothetical protein
MRHPSRRRHILSRPSGLLLLVMPACGHPPIDWDAQRSLARPSGVALALSADGTARPDTMVTVTARLAQPTGPSCTGSLRVASLRGTLIGVWWAPRPDSGVSLLSARSGDHGRSWSAPAVVDTTDTGLGGCHRAPASIAADSASGYVHVTYALQAAEGPGLFFSHSMDGGVSFHAPVPIIYGDRLGRTSVAADGDFVVVGFEDPNSSAPRIGLALSRTMGHIFEQRIVPVSDDNGAAMNPLTAVRGGRVAVAWEPGPVGTAPGTLIVRTGTIR